MAKLCKVNKDKRQRKLVSHFQVIRAALRAQIRDPNLSFEKKLLVQKKMQDLPKDSNRCRLRNRCLVTGRSRGVYRRFGLGRTKLREFAMQGLIPGIRKASW
ncbi:MAG: 30S ribosomal protein S14 [Gammaproteobacteria bacterium]|nr:30S ribosomal protein S14 [Gammaproteobacteria bacterium]MBP9728528.1 30S ribosomal protein S14 [Gammaproteobacteria bacterium]